MSLKRIVHLFVSLTLLSACTRVHPKIEISENVCSQFSLQGAEWTAHQVKTGLGCVLYGKGQPSTYFDAVMQAPEEDFIETTRWLNARLAREQRAAFFGQLEEFPPELAATLEDVTASAFFAEAPVAENVDFLSKGLSALALNQAELYRLVNAAVTRLDTPQGRWSPTPALTRAAVDFGLGIQGIEAQERPHFLGSIARMADGLADSPEAQRALGLMGDRITCRKGEGVTIEAPLNVAIEQIVANRNDPARFFTLVGQTYAPWREMCDPDPAFAPAAMGQVFDFMRSNYGDIVSYAPIALSSRMQSIGAAFLVAAADSGAGNPLPALKATRAYHAMFKAITRPGPGSDWLAQMPSRENLLALTDAMARSSAMRHFVDAGPEGFLRLESAIRVLSPDSALLREWQGWMTRLGPELLPAVGRYAREGHFRKLSQDIQKWTGEKSLFPAQGEAGVPDLALPDAIAATRSCGPIARRIIDHCLTDASLGVAASYSCLRQNAPAALSYSFFEGPSFAAFVKRIDGRDPMFRMARAIYNSGWLRDQAFDRFVGQVIDALAPYRVNAAATLTALARGETLARGDLEAFIRVLKGYRFPRLRTDRLRWLGYPAREPKPEGLPEGWLAWIGSEYPDQLVEALFGDPQTVRILSRGTHRRVAVTLKQARDGHVSEGTLNLNGLELMDALIWEAQVKPAFGHGDRFIMKTIVHDMLKMQTAEQVVAWLAKTSRLLDRVIPLMRAMTPFSDTVPRLENARVLVHAIQDNVSPEVILTVTQLGVRSLPERGSLTEKTAIFSLQHHLGLFVSLSKWLEDWRTNIDAGRVVLGPAARAQLANGFKVFMGATTEQDILDISRANLITDGSLLGSGMGLYVSAVLQNRPALMPWLSGVVTGLGLDIMTQFAGPAAAEPYEDMQRIFGKANGILDEISLRLSIGDGPESVASLIAFTAARGRETTSLRDADLVQRLSSPQGRAEMLAWVRTGALSSLINWSRLVHAPNS